MDIVSLRARLAEIETELRNINDQAEGRALDPDQQARWDELDAEYGRLEKQEKEYEARTARVAQFASRAANREDEPKDEPRRSRVTSHVPDDPTDLDSYRLRATSIEDLNRSLKEGARRIVDDMLVADHADENRSKTHIDRLLKRDGEDAAFARRVIATSSETYERAFGKALMGAPLTPDEQRALSTTGSAGGYAVPVALDPTVILTSDGVISPIRQLARVETLTGTNHWQGVSSAGITAAFAAEAAEASDNAPTLAQPEVYAEKAHAFVPFSIEIGQDWGSLAQEMARLFQDAKDDLESDKFLTGLGHSSNQPEGLLVGATAVVETASASVIAAADLYSLIQALAPRWRRRASITANRAAYDKVRQLDTQGGANLWTTLQFNQPRDLVGFPAYEWSEMSSSITTGGASVMTIGDFSQFLIVDRAGMDVELVNHLFATANNRPSGQRGLYCHWRVSSDVLTIGAFKTLKIKS